MRLKIFISTEIYFGGKMIASIDSALKDLTGNWAMMINTGGSERISEQTQDNMKKNLMLQRNFT